jgi:hypothetical protein
MIANSTEHLPDLVQTSLQQPCWYVSSGGAAGASFQLALGEKIPREKPLSNPGHPREYRENEGEVNLLVWCTWRLRDDQHPISSSDDSPDHVREALTRLVNASVAQVELISPAWDLRLHFSNGLVLEVFCDHLSDDASFDGNWELWLTDKVVSVGAGCDMTLEPRK